MLPLLQAEAKARQAVSGPGIYGGKPLRTNLPEVVSGKHGKSTDIAAEVVQVGSSSIGRARVGKGAAITAPQGTAESRALLAFGHDEQFGPACGFDLVLAPVFPEFFKFLPHAAHPLHQGLDEKPWLVGRHHSRCYFARLAESS